MNISVIIPYSHRVGGAYNYITAFVDALIIMDEVERINLICISDALISIKNRYVDNNKTSIHAYNDKNIYVRKILNYFGYAPKINNEVLNLLEVINADVFVTTAPWNEGVHSWVGKRVVIIHDFFNWPKGKSKSNFFSGERDRGRKSLEMLAFADYVICESECTAKKINEAAKIYNLNNVKLSIVALPPAYGPSLMTAPPLAKLKGLIYWFVPSHITPLKNQEVVIDALIALKKDNFHPNVVFSFPSFSYTYFAKILFKIAKYNLWAQVCLMYKASNEEMQSLYENCCGVILPTKIGPTNMPVVEAIEFGKICITTRISTIGFGEIYKLEKFESDDFKELATLMKVVRPNLSNNSYLNGQEKKRIPSQLFRCNIRGFIKMVFNQ